MSRTPKKQQSKKINIILKKEEEKLQKKLIRFIIENNIKFNRDKMN